MPVDLFEQQQEQPKDLFQGADLLENKNSTTGDPLGRGAAFDIGLASAIPYGQRITSGMGALGAAALGAGNIKDLYEQAQANTEATKEAHPGWFGAGEAVGYAEQIPTGLGLAKFIKGAPLAKDASLLSRFAINPAMQAGRGAITSAPVSAAYSAGEAPSIEQMPEYAKTGAELGAGIGAALPMATRAILGTAGSIKSGVGKMFTPIEQHAENFWQNRVTPAQAKQVASIKYDLADKTGGALSPEKRNEFLDESAGAGREKSAVPRSQLVQNTLDNLEKTRGEPLTLRQAQSLEEDINNAITYQPNGMLTPESTQLLKIKRALRSTLNGATPEDMVGGAEGWGAWQDAKKAYSAAAILTDIKNMIGKATYSTQPASQLERNLARWSLKSSNTAGLDPEEMDFVKDAIKTDFAHEILRTGSSRLLPIARGALGLATGHGALGAIAGTVEGMGLRNAGFANQLERMKPLADAIGERLPSIAAPEASLPAAIKQHSPIDFHNPIPAGADLPGVAGYAGTPAPDFSLGAVGEPTQYQRPAVEMPDVSIPPRMKMPKFSPHAYDVKTTPSAPTEAPDPTDIMKDFFKSKASGGRIGFKLKKKDK